MATSDTSRQDGEVENNNRSETWKRGLFMLLLIIFFGLAQSLLFMGTVVQFLWLLFARSPNALLVRFGASLGKWLEDTARFLTCASEEKPFPWREWPAPG